MHTKMHTVQTHVHTARWVIITVDDMVQCVCSLSQDKTTTHVSSQDKAMTSTSVRGDENLLCRGVQLHPDRQGVPRNDGLSFQGDPHLDALN